MSEKNYKSVSEFGNLINLKEVGNSLEGKFIKSYEYTAKDKEVYTIHVLGVTAINGKTQDVAEGQIFGSGSLDHLMSKVVAGDDIRITYLGLTDKEVETKFGKKKIHQFNVEKAV